MAIIPTSQALSYTGADGSTITLDDFKRGLGKINANDVIGPKTTAGIYDPTAQIFNSSNIYWNNAYLPVTGAYVNTTNELLWNINKAMTMGSGGSDITPVDPSDIDNNLIISMFKAIQCLQAEVLRLRNSFLCGIESYKEKETHMSHVINDDYTNIIDEEPLWATDETELTWINDANTDITQGNLVFTEEPGQNIPGSMQLGDNADVGRLIFTDSKKFSWTCPEDSTLLTTEDAKLYMYLTLNNLNSKVEIDIENNTIIEETPTQSTDGHIVTTSKEVNLGEENKIIIDLGEVFANQRMIQGITESSRHNVLIIVSRAIKNAVNNASSPFKGNRFIWISFNDYYKDNVETFGYYDIETHTLSKTPIYISNSTLVDVEKDPLCFSKLTLWGNTIYKFDLYSKYQDFQTDNSNATIEGGLPSDDTYKYKAAHIQIRSVKLKSTLISLVNQLVEDELIFCEEEETLYIVKNKALIKIGAKGGSSDDDTMTEQEVNNLILQYLLENNLIKNEKDTDTGDWKEISTNDPRYSDSVERLITQLNINYDDILEHIELNEIEKINMKNELGENFDISIDNNGNLIVDKVDDANSEQSVLYKMYEKNNGWKSKEDSTYRYVLYDQSTNTYSINKAFFGKRGFQAATYGPSNYESTKDTGLQSDRVKIASVYAPLTTDNVFGCTHGFIELENTSDKDFYLDGCYIYFYKLEGNTQAIHRLKLKGKIPAGGTYLIRCKKYSDISQENTYIDVKTYDIEWYDKECYSPDEDLIPTKELLDISMNSSGSYSLMLLFGSNYKLEEDFFAENKSQIPFISNQSTTSTGTKITVAYKAGYIDAVPFNKVTYWVNNGSKTFALGSNRIYKNMFELDPAKQAFNGLDSDAKDSSRYRLNGAPDLQLLDLANEYITFPKTTDRVKYVTDYTPKASFEHKNVLTDKTVLDDNHPNAVSCFFGIDPNKTRCFNWVSKGIHDEYIWLRKKGTTSWGTPIESYSRNNITIKNSSSSSVLRRDTYYSDAYVLYNTNYTKIENGNRYTYNANSETYTQSNTGTYLKINDNYIELKTSDDNNGNKENIYIKINKINNVYIKSSEYLNLFKAFYADPVKNRLSGGLPGNDVQFSAHKVIIDLYSSSYNESAPETWEYIVGRKKQFTNNPDELFISDIMEFTVYPKDWGTPIIYQTTDQQGFHWQEYQVWSAAADKLYEVMNNEHDSHENKTYPVLINTGDAVQSGARINEWLDYYDGGKNLFKKYEQLNIVGNNDLCNSSNEWALGTGNDDGKSNSFFYHIFNCNEIAAEDLNKLTVSKINYVDQDNPGITRCIPSTYYVDFPVHDNNDNTKDYTFRLLMLNTEVTAITCRDWYKLYYSNEKDNRVYNIYTGWRLESTIKVEDNDALYYKDNDSNNNTNTIKNRFTPIYDTLYQWTEPVAEGQKERRYILACHEMPFTVITNASLNINNNDVCKQFRSISDANKLVGCHANEIEENPTKTTGKGNFDKPGLHWLSRLLEYRHIHLCIGGHKHTYAVTYPLVENFWWKENDEWVNSVDHNYNMTSDLSNDNISWSYQGDSTESKYDSINTSKLPYTLVDKIYNNNNNPDYGDATKNAIIVNYKQTAEGNFIKINNGFYELFSNNDDVFVLSSIDNLYTNKKYIQDNNGDYYFCGTNGEEYNMKLYSLISNANRYNRTGEEGSYTYTQNDNGSYLKYNNKYYEIIAANRYNVELLYTQTDNGTLLKYNDKYYEIVAANRYNRIGEEGSYTYTQAKNGTYLKINDNYVEIVNSNKYIPYVPLNGLTNGGNNINLANIINESDVSKLFNTGYFYYVSDTTISEIFDINIYIEDSNNSTWTYNSVDKILPGIPKSGTGILDAKHVIYFMCQATGYKLKSNKELPSNSQVFSFIIPQTTHSGSSDTPSGNQLYPMSSKICINTDKTYSLYLTRYTNILKTKGKDNFNQQTYNDKNPMGLEYLAIRYHKEGDTIDDIKYGDWGSNETPLLNNFNL